MTCLLFATEEGYKIVGRYYYNNDDDRAKDSEYYEFAENGIVFHGTKTTRKMVGQYRQEGNLLVFSEVNSDFDSLKGCVFVALSENVILRYWGNKDHVYILVKYDGVGGKWF
jgi:hypothetical protein